MSKTESIECPDCEGLGKIEPSGELSYRCRKCMGLGFVRRKVTTPEPLSGNDRLCAAIAEVLMREDLTPEARALVQLALRTQRGEVVDLRAEMERRG